MSATGSSHLTHDPASDLYDPDDDVLPKNSPLLAPTHPTLRLSPKLQVTITVPSSSSDSSPEPPPRPNRRMKTQPSQGDAVLISALDGGRRPLIALQAGIEALPSDTDEEIDHHSSSSDSIGEGIGNPFGPQPEEGSMAVHSPATSSVGAFDLKSLAASALTFAEPPTPAAVDAGPTPPVSEHDVVRERHVPPPLSQPITIRQGEPPVKREHVPLPHGVPTPYSPPSIPSPRDTGPGSLVSIQDLRSPSGGPPSAGHGEGLPPIQLNSPRSDTSGQTPLPSIRAQLGDFNELATNHVAEKERMRNAHHGGYPHSPPGNLPRLPSMNHASPPISPATPYQFDPLSPNRPYNAVPNQPFYYRGGNPNGLHRSPHDYASSAAVSPGSEQSGSTPATSIAEKMNLDPMQPATYVCKFPGCTAAAFQTQYLLNSHANVHSSARPHYCPIKGCPRSEGGRGFKRKNEMIRHGLVHESPGYVCPFCPDREHKYPRPDNLQRHVRVHHVDKDKDDPLLREVLAQRADGPSKGRRRRGNQS